MQTREWERHEGATPQEWYQVKVVLYSDGSAQVLTTRNGRTVLNQCNLDPEQTDLLQEMLGIDHATRQAMKLEAKIAKCESPMEVEFLKAVFVNAPDIVPQYEVGTFRVDFALPEQKIAVEVDGHEFHSSREQRTKDAQRERVIERGGWRIVRFTGTEIHADAKACAEEFYKQVLEIKASKLPF